MGAGKKAPAFAKAGGRIRRPSAGYALPFGHAYRRGGYRLTPSGLRAPAHRERQAKPRALSGRGACLCFGLRVSAKAVLQLGVGFLIYRISRLAKRIDGGIVGAQASGDARAPRHPIGFVREAPDTLTIGLSLARRVFLSSVQYAHDFDMLGCHLVDHDVVRVGDDFACAWHTARAVQVRMLGSRQYGRLDQATHAASCWRTIVGDEADDGGEVCAC